MEQLKIIENKDWLTRRTGDPFADAGAYVIELMQKEYQNDSILQLIERAARIYVEDWKEKSVIFYVFPNSKMINVSIKGDRVKQIVEDFKQMFSGAYQGMVNGYCRVLGEKTHLFPVGKN